MKNIIFGVIAAAVLAVGVVYATSGKADCCKTQEACCSVNAACCAD